MAKQSKTVKQILDQYVVYIATAVIKEYGGSYQNFQTMGETWRKKIPYNSIAEDFILYQTDLFLISLKNRNCNDFNLMYKVCNDISKYLALYLARKLNDDVSKEVLNDVSAKVLDRIFLNSRYFVPKFYRFYKRPIDPTNEKFARLNPGVMAMFNAQQKKR